MSADAGPIYDLNDPAQAASLLAGLPTRSHRVGVLDRWRRQRGEQWAHEVGERLRELVEQAAGGVA